MVLCPACRQSVPEDSRFCGFCGFKLTPIAEEEYHRLSESIPPLGAEEPVLLTQVKQSAKKPQVSFVPNLPTGVPRSLGGPRNVPQSESGDLMTSPTEATGFKNVTPSNKSSVPPETLVPEVRQFHRYPLKIEVSYGSDHNFYTGFIENLSSGGLFVATHQLVTIGQIFELSFTVPGLARVCTAICRVRWIREYNPLMPEMVPGMGLQFSQIDSEARAAIELFIKHREPIFFDDD